MNNEFFNQVKRATHYLKVTRSQVKELQEILKEHHQRDVDLDEAKEVSRELVGLYDLLAGDQNIVDRSQEHSHE